MEHNKIDKKYQYGWYGSCEEECKSLFFDKLGDARNYIDSIVRVSYADGKSFEKYTSYDKENLDWVDSLPDNQTFDDYINPQFSYMDCGMGYLVIRNDSGDFGASPEISNFTVAHHFGESGGFIAVDGCPDVTPTPTPLAPFIEINNITLFRQEGQVRFDVTIDRANAYQYEISGDSNVYKVLPGNDFTTTKIIDLEPGVYTLKVTATSDAGEPFTRNDNSTDERVFTLLSPEPTPTPTPTPSPTPTLTPVNCNCIPSTHDTVTQIQNLGIQPFSTDDGVSGTFTFVADTEIGINLDDLKPNSEPNASNFTFTKPDGTSLTGAISIKADLDADEMIIYIKPGDESVCYIAKFTDLSQSGVIQLQLAELPPECVGTPTPTPTPTPESAECCDDTDFSIDITAQTGGSMTNTINFVELPFIMDGSLGKLCWKTFGTPADTAAPLIFNCPIANSDGTYDPESWDNGGFTFQVRGIITDENRNIKFEHINGKCYKATLKGSDDLWAPLIEE